MSEDEGELPLLHRIAIVYLMLPVGIWLVGWFEWWVGIPASVLLAIAFRQALTGSWRATPRVATVVILAVAVCWVMMTAAGGVFDSYNQDWLDHRSILLNLTRYPWPVFLPDDLIAPYAPDKFNSPPLLRAYLGYFLTPGLVGHWLGPAALNWAVPIWTWLGVVLILLMFTRERTRWGVALAVLIFVFFSGMDILREVLPEEYAWRTYMQYSPNMVGLTWVPQHFIPAGLYVFLCLQLRSRRRFLAVSGILLAAAPFWSPFVAIGLLPFIAILLWENGVRPFLRWPNLLLAAPLAALIALYLVIGDTDIRKGWIWDLYEWPLIAWGLPVFYLTEFLLLGILLLILRPDLRREPFFIACMATLILLPLDHYDAANILPRRAGFPALVLLCYYCVETIEGGHRRISAPFDLLARAVSRIAARWPSRLELLIPRRHANESNGIEHVSARYSLGVACIVAILAIGSVRAFQEITRAVDLGDLAWRGGYFDTSIMEANRRYWHENVAYDIPNVLRVLLDDELIFPRREMEKGKLIIRSEFDVYLEQNMMLIYVKEPCSPADIEHKFFLHAYPVDHADLPESRKQYGFHNLDFTFKKGNLINDVCVGIGSPPRLPRHKIAKIVTGQFSKEGRIWSAEANIIDE